MSREILSSETVERFAELIWTSLTVGRSDADKIAATIAPEIERLLAQEREKVRELCSAALRKIEGGGDGWNFAIARAEMIIRHLDLTKELAPSSREGGGDAK